MDIFLSWSGDKSRRIAEGLKQWLPDVIQAAKPFISTDDIRKGKRWPIELGETLEAVNFGIICVTSSNLDAPWLNFEAGALGKLLEDSHVSPFLVGVRKADVTGPLAQFQMTSYDQADVFRMVRDINEASSAPLELDRLTRNFERLWPELQAILDPIAEEPENPGAADTVRRTDDAILEEVLELVRRQQRDLDEAIGDRRWTFRGNARLDPLSHSDYRQIALGLAMLRTLATIERGEYYRPEEAVAATLQMLQDPLEVLLARARAPHIYSLYFDDSDGKLRLTYTEERRENDGQTEQQEVVAMLPGSEPDDQPESE